MVYYLSSAPFLLYEGCSWIDKTEREDLYRNFLRRNGQICPVLCVYEAENIERTKINVIANNKNWEETLTRICDESKSYLPPSFLSILKDVFINNNALYFGGTTDTVMLYEMHRPNDRPSTAVNYQINLRSNINFNSHMNRKNYFYIGSAGISNYGHWLVDDLPRLKALELYLEHNDDRNVIILLTSYSSIIDNVRLETIRMHPKLKDIEVCFLDISQNYRFEFVYYVSPVSYHPEIKLRSSLNYIRDTYAPLVGSTSKLKLYVTRKSTTGRRVANTEEIEAFLVQHGFDVVDCSSLSFKQQLEYFVNANVIVGVMGAAMTNCIFSPKGAMQIHLACEGWVEPFYWDLAEGCSHKYFSIYGEALEVGAPYDVMFNIDIKQIAYLLEKNNII